MHKLAAVFVSVFIALSAPALAAQSHPFSELDTGGALQLLGSLFRITGAIDIVVPGKGSVLSTDSQGNVNFAGRINARDGITLPDGKVVRGASDLRGPDFFTETTYAGATEKLFPGNTKTGTLDKVKVAGNKISLNSQKFDYQQPLTMAKLFEGCDSTSGFNFHVSGGAEFKSANGECIIKSAARAGGGVNAPNPELKYPGSWVYLPTNLDTNNAEEVTFVYRTKNVNSRYITSGSSSYTNTGIRASANGKEIVVSPAGQSWNLGYNYGPGWTWGMTGGGAPNYYRTYTLIFKSNGKVDLYVDNGLQLQDIQPRTYSSNYEFVQFVGFPDVEGQDAIDWIAVLPGAHKPNEDIVAESGSYISPAMDAGRTVSWSSMRWGQTIMAGTSATVYARSSPDGNAWSSWVNIGSSGNNETISRNAAGVPANRYLQYKVDMKSALQKGNPVVELLDVEYKTCPVAGCNALSVGGGKAIIGASTIDAGAISAGKATIGSLNVDTINGTPAGGCSVVAETDLPFSGYKSIPVPSECRGSGCKLTLTIFANQQIYNSNTGQYEYITHLRNYIDGIYYQDENNYYAGRYGGSHTSGKNGDTSAQWVLYDQQGYCYIYDDIQTTGGETSPDSWTLYDSSGIPTKCVLEVCR